MTIGLVTGAVKWLNDFPSMTGVSKTLSPGTIVKGIPKPNIKHKHIVHGAHAMVYAGTNNKMDARCIPGVALNSSNEHGGQYFMLLYSRKRISSYRWKELPIDEDVIDRVESLAEVEEAPEMSRGYPIFTWKRRVLDDPELNVNDAVEDELPVDDTETDIIVHDVNEEDNNNDNPDDGDEEQYLQEPKGDHDNVVPLDEDEPGFDQEMDTNYITDDGSVDGEEESKAHPQKDDEQALSDIAEEEDTGQVNKVLDKEERVDEEVTKNNKEAETRGNTRP